jgi:predicted dehydrogenase
MTRRIGIIGLGMAATKHVVALRELGGRTQVVGAWSPSQQRRATFGEKFGLPTPDSAEATSLDLLLILTPPWTHLDLVSRAAAARKHVLLESLSRRRWHGGRSWCALPPAPASRWA